MLFKTQRTAPLMHIMFAHFTSIFSHCRHLHTELTHLIRAQYFLKVQIDQHDKKPKTVLLNPIHFMIVTEVNTFGLLSIYYSHQDKHVCTTS